MRINTCYGNVVYSMNLIRFLFCSRLRLSLCFTITNMELGYHSYYWWMGGHSRFLFTITICCEWLAIGTSRRFIVWIFMNRLFHSLSRDFRVLPIEIPGQHLDHHVKDSSSDSEKSSSVNLFNSFTRVNISEVIIVTLAECRTMREYIDKTNKH